MLAPATPLSDPTLAFSGIPTIPVRVWEEEGCWKKQPLAEWNQATINEDQLERWWRRWPDARPGVPLAAVGWCAIDVDDPDCGAFWEVWNGLGPRGPYSKVRTVSGGWHFVFEQPPEPISKMQWCEGVEILGTSCLLTIHDVEAILFPRVAPRAILPEVFRKPHVRLEGCPTNKDRPSAHRPPTPLTDIADVDEALFKLDACEWRKRHDDWLALMIGCKSEGGSENGFVRWSLSDPHYTGDERIIRRKWRSIEPGHGGALFKALAEHGIRLRPQSKAEPFLIGGAHISAKVPAKAGDRPKPPPNLHSRSDGLLRWLASNQSADGLFSAACLLCELGVTQAITTRLVDGNLPGLRRELGEAEFSYQITRAFAWVTAKGEPL